jgi:hypothetical protein
MFNSSNRGFCNQNLVIRSHNISPISAKNRSLSKESSNIIINQNSFGQTVVHGADDDYDFDNSPTKKIVRVFPTSGKRER